MENAMWYDSLCIIGISALVGRCRIRLNSAEHEHHPNIEGNVMNKERKRKGHIIKGQES